MFRRSAYNKVGGYRSEFYFAQDLDLWVRLVEIGSYVLIPEVLYQARVVPSDISRCYKKKQIKLTKYLLESKRLRLGGLSEDHILSKAAKILPNSNERLNRFTQAKAFYFIGACLKQKDHCQARKYFKQAIKSNPFHFRSWFRFLFGHNS
jgi:tetratricopeptide (TPR) repeat protein